MAPVFDLQKYCKFWLQPLAILSVNSVQTYTSALLLFDSLFMNDKVYIN
jgi:hypothetical protein